MEELYNYYCQYCSQFLNMDTTVSIACPGCHEYKGLIKVSITSEEEAEEHYGA